MKHIPILFSTEMVQAILQGRKTQTRRVVKPQPHPYGTEIIDSGKPWFKNKGRWHNRFKTGDNPDRFEIASTHDCPYGQPGDVLWVRETFFCDAVGEYWYKATPNGSGYPNKYKPAIHMPKAACRLWLKVKAVRVERLQDISEAEAKAEGVYYDNYFQKFSCYQCDKSGHKLRHGNLCEDGFYNNAKSSFQSLWSSINGADSWNTNPWVWVVEFERCEMPADFLQTKPQHITETADFKGFM